MHSATRHGHPDFSGRSHHFYELPMRHDSRVPGELDM